ncbi:AraC family transcriptional regulator [Parahaliea mediterranea]|uniref:AraC family transcriptional regulator n=1 Tax=Parahaliea mediterranea TaxID=651086 RepID=A0A939INM8_9GAMM|nr:AraC family transcriptional regulator [Parahaliea mediterranea]MBN7798288.1 AraC family transcriptional regulator [Parahaliea mediterranea]
MPKTSTPAQYILILIDMVEEQGHSRERLLAGTSLASTGIHGIGARVNEEDFARLVANAFELTGDAALGLHLGLRLNLSAHAVLGQAFMTCRDLRQVMDLFLKYYHLLSPALYLEFEVRDGRFILTTVSTPEENPISFAYELMYAATLNTLRGLLNMPDLRMRIEVPYAAPGYAAEYNRVFGDDVHFDAVRGRISFDETLLDTPLPSSNPALRALYEEECARLLADLEEEDSVAEQTLRLLRKLEGQYPQMPQIAKMLNFSPRTYRRRLEQEGLSFQQLLDKVRAEHATRYLQNTRLPLATIAYLVGFNDPSNFRRAYQGWTGRSPREVRGGG